MQDVVENGICTHHGLMAKQVSEIHSLLCGDQFAIPPVSGMASEHRELMDDYCDRKENKKSRAKFLWETFAGYIITSLLSSGVVFLALKG